MKYLIKQYLKLLTKEQRSTRLMCVGKRLKFKQNHWLHFNNHPFESHDIEERDRQ